MEQEIANKIERSLVLFKPDAVQRGRLVDRKSVV